MVFKFFLPSLLQNPGYATAHKDWNQSKMLSLICVDKIIILQYKIWFNYKKYLMHPLWKLYETVLKTYLSSEKH